MPRLLRPDDLDPKRAAAEAARREEQERTAAAEILQLAEAIRWRDQDTGERRQ